MSNNQTPIVFKGDAGDYFGIWIVNLLLSMVTLGIYSAWAKVRRKKYFYNNTLIDGVGFDYHGDPIAILKGRIIAFVLLVLYTVLSNINPILGTLLAVLLFISIPWIVVRGMMFNARNTSHRGLRFDFDAKTGTAALVFVGYPLLLFLSLGLAFPFVIQRTNQFFINHHKFGTSHFQMNALVKDFYSVYLKLLGVLTVLGLVFSFAMGGLISHFKTQTESVSFNQSTPMQTATLQPSGFIQVANETPAETVTEEAEIKKIMDQMEGSETTENNPATNTPTKPDPVAEAFKKYYALYGGIIILVVLVFIFLYMSAILLIIAYIKSRITNLIMNNTSLDHIGFFSNQRMRDLVWLYFSNILLLMFSGGLAMPWTQIRMVRYQMQHLALIGETDLDQFVGEKKESTRALGEELADMFDVDISFG